MKKVYYFLMLLFCAGIFKTYAQTDICSNAPIIQLANNVTQTFTGNTSTATQDGSEAAPTIWYAFKTPATGGCTYVLEISYCGSVTNPTWSYNFIFDGCDMSAGFNVASVGLCSNNNNIIYFDGLDPNTTYYYPIIGAYMDNPVGSYSISVVATQTCAPSNDECSGATVTTVPDGTTQTVTGTTFGSTMDDYGPFVWEAINLPSLSAGCTYNLTATFCGTTPTMAYFLGELYSDCSNQATPTYTGSASPTDTCPDYNPYIEFTDIAPGTYYFPILGYYNDGSGGVNFESNYTLNVSATSNCPSNNDICDNVTPVNLSDGIAQNFTGTTVGATMSGIEAAPEVWEAFTTPPGAGCTYTVSVDYCNSPTDYTYTGNLSNSCDATGNVFIPHQEACSSGNNVISKYYNLQPSTTYYLPIIGYYDDGTGNVNPDGPYSINVTANKTCPPPNDLCANVTPATLTNNVAHTFSGTTAGAQTNGSEDLPIVWESFTVPGSTGCNYSVEISFCGSNTSTALIIDSIYQSCNMVGGIQGVFSTCSDGNAILNFTDIPAGTYYYPVLGNFYYGTDPISSNPEGPYSFTVTATAPTVTTPTITANGPTSFCNGGSVILTSSAPTGNVWSNGATTQSITITSAGNYSVYTTNGSCQSASSSPVTVTINTTTTPTISVSGSTALCNGGSVTLTSSAATGNTWSNGAIGQSITVSSAGTYTVTATGSNGCISSPSTPVSVTVGTTPPTPTITASGSTTFCSGGSVVLTSSASSGNVWSNGATTPSITVTNSGNYSVSVTNGTCTSNASTPISVTVNPTPATPTITASGSLTFCDGGSVTLTSSAATGNHWSNGAITQSITVNADGVFTVYVSNGAGCQSATSASVTVDEISIPATPTITTSGSTTFCSGGSVVLTSSATSGNVWSNGATTPSITVTNSGNYSVSVTNGTCTSNTSTPISVTVNPTPATPTITASGPLTFCDGGSVILTSSTATGNHWSNGATTPSITVNGDGVFTVYVSNVAGCQSATSASVTVDEISIPATPTITTSGPTTFCSGGSVTLTSSASSGNVWSNGATTPSITVTNSGNYSVSVTNGTCTSNASTPISVTVNPTPATPTITASGPLTFCDGGSVILTSSAATGNHWSNGATTPSITVNGDGVFTVYVSNAAGCQSATSASVTVDEVPLPSIPTITTSGPTTFCTGGSVTLTSSSSSGNVWSNGATTPSITVTTSGTYSVSVNNGNCSSDASAPVNVTVNTAPAAPTVTASGPLTFCEGGSVTLTSSASSGNTWSTGATTSSITVNTSGSYTVANSNANGCSSASSAAVAVLVNPTPATPTITPAGPLTVCEGASVTITSSAANGNTWSNGETTSSITVNTAGDYSVSVSANGCNSGTSNVVNISVSPIPEAPTVTPAGPLSVCDGETVTLSSSVTDGNVWSNGANTPIVEVGPGSYSVTYVDDNGCTSEASNSVTVNETPGATVDDISIVQGSNGNVTATAVNPQNVNTYTWDFGDGSGSNVGSNPQAHTYSDNGAYTVSLSASNDCAIATADKDISIDNITGIANLKIDEKLLMVYPNPSQNYLIIENKSNFVMQSITVYDITGRNVYHAQINGANLYKINIAHLLSGNYFLQIDTDKGTAVRKFDIAH